MSVSKVDVSGRERGGGEEAEKEKEKEKRRGRKSKLLPHTTLSSTPTPFKC